MKSANGLANQSGWALSELLSCAKVRGAPPVSSAVDATITSLVSDSRSVRRGSCFVALRGTETDGHRYVAQAVDAGAAVVVVERDVTVPPGAIVLHVADTHETLSRLAATFYDVGLPGHAPRLIGITGTNGKTTVAWMIRAILTEAGRRPALFGTIEYDLLDRRLEAPLTTPGPVELARYLQEAKTAGATDAVVEVSSHALDQRRCDGFSFAAGVFTNLSGDHLDYHGSVEAYRAAKRRLLESLDGGAVAAINRDDAEHTYMASGLDARVVSFGLDTPGADVRAAIESVDASGSRFVVRGVSMTLPIRLRLVGRHNISNALAAVAVCEALGVEGDAIGRGLDGLSGIPGRLQHAEPPGWPFPVLVDYAHTDDALHNVLGELRAITRGRLICVFGCGGDRDRSKRQRMAAAVEARADIAIVTSDNPRSEEPSAIVEEILSGFGVRSACRVTAEVDRRRAIERAIGSARAGDTVLIAGKGHETYQLIGDRVLDFDDVAVARACLELTDVKENVA